MKIQARVGGVLIGMTALAVLSGCQHYVKRSEFDATVAELRGDIGVARAESRDQIAALGRDLEGKLKNQEVAITDLQDRLRLDMTAHFDFDKSELRSADEQALNEFVDVMRKRPQMEVTVEGYADSAGSPAYNKKLGQRRAESVREHLVAEGLPADKVKAVSYGDQRNRQLAPGAWGEQGQANRRVALVVQSGSNEVGGLDATASSKVARGDDGGSTQGASH